MDVRNCRNCKRLFNYIGGAKLCPACKEELEKKFTQVKEYIRNNKSASLKMISEDNEVSVQQLHQWVREERLVFTEESMVGLDCEKCGKTIRTGRYCDQCKNQMLHDFGNVYKKEEKVITKKDPRSREKMRFLDN